YVLSSFSERYQRRHSGLRERPQRQTRDELIDVASRFGLDHQSERDASSNRPTAHDLLFVDQLFSPRNRREDDLINESSGRFLLQRRTGPHMIEFDKKQHGASRIFQRSGSFRGHSRAKRKRNSRKAALLRTLLTA